MAVRFTTRDLLWSVTLLSVGVGSFAILFRHPNALSLLIYVVGCGFIGAGIVAPFQRKVSGAVWGAAFGLVLIIVAFLIIANQYQRSTSHSRASYRATLSAKK